MGLGCDGGVYGAALMRHNGRVRCCPGYSLTAHWAESGFGVVVVRRMFDFAVNEVSAIKLFVGKQFICIQPKIVLKYLVTKHEIFICL